MSILLVAALKWDKSKKNTRFRAPELMLNKPELMLNKTETSAVNQRLIEAVTHSATFGSR